MVTAAKRMVMGILLMGMLLLTACQPTAQPTVPAPLPTPVEHVAAPVPAPVPPVVVPEPLPAEVQKKGEVIPRIERQELTIEGDDAGIYPKTITVKKGALIQITFKVRQARTYYGGLDFRSPAWGDTGRIPPGGSKTIEFTAENSFDYTSYWPSSNVKKATGKVVVE